MKAQINKIKEKIKTYLGKVLKNEKDTDLNAHVKDEAKFRKMYENTKVY